MKLRIRDDALRLRLGQSEVGRIAAGRTVAGRMHLPDGSVFAYRLQGREYGTPDVSIDDTGLMVSIDVGALRAWASGDAVSLRAHCAGPSAVLEVIVEKDFACLSERPGDDDADSFPHPAAGAATC